MKRTIAAIIAVLTLCLCLAGCGVAEPQEYKYVLYCGINDGDTGEQILTRQEAADIARAIITDNGCGYTERIAYGAAAGTDGEVTLVDEILFADEAAAMKIAEEIRIALNQQSVLVDAFAVRAELVA